MKSGDPEALWRETRRTTFGWLTVWAAGSFPLPWFARALEQWLPHTWSHVVWIAMLLTLPLFLLVIVGHVRRMERLEADYLAQRGSG